MSNLVSPELMVTAREAADELLPLMGELPERQRAFAASLVANVKRYHPSKTQAEWVMKLLKVAVTPPEAMPVSPVGNLKGLVALFKAATLKYPKLTIDTDNGKLKLSLCGSRSKTPGWVTMTDGRPYGDNTWYGRVDPDGNWEQSFSGTHAAEWITPILEAFSKDAESAAKDYASKSGSCVFCHKELTTDSSLEVGYGPVCAKNWGLPWGAK